MNGVIEVERVGHVGIRVSNADRAVRFLLGFEVVERVTFDPLIIIRRTWRSI